MGKRSILKRAGALFLAAALAVISIPSAGFADVMAEEQPPVGAPLAASNAEITVTVTDSGSNALSGAVVKIGDVELTENTTAGTYFSDQVAVDAASGELELTVELEGYGKETAKVSYSENSGKITGNAAVTLYKYYTVSGTITGSGEDGTALPLAGASLSDGSAELAATDANGVYSFEILETASLPFTVYVTSADPKYEKDSMEITALTENITKDFHLGIKQFKVTADPAVTHGSVQVMDGPDVSYGGEKRIDIAANHQYAITAVKVNGADVPEGDIVYQPGRMSAVFTLKDITEDKTVTAEFGKTENAIQLQFDEQNELQNPDALGLLRGADIQAEKIDNDTATRITVKLAKDFYLKSAETDLPDIELPLMPESTQGGSVYVYTVNQKAAQSLTLTSGEDKADPVMGEIEGVQDADNWKNDEYSLWLYPNDADSGIYKVLFGKTKEEASEIQAELNPENNANGYKLIIPKESYKGSYYVSIEDKVGRSVSKDILVQTDVVSPIVNELNSNSAGEWTNDKIQIEVKASDDLSGVKAVYYNTSGAIDLDDKDTYKQGVYDPDTGTALIEVTETNYNGKYYVWVQDVAGNLSESNSIDVKIDTGSPVIGKIGPESNVKYEEADTHIMWNDKTIKILIEASDPTIPEIGGVASGIAKVYVKAGDEPEREAKKAETSENGPYTYVIDSIEGKSFHQTYSIWCVDNAGNVSAPKEVQYGIDKGQPRITNLDIKVRNDSVLSDLVNKFTFGLFCNKEVEVIVTAADDEGGTGLKEAMLFTKNAEGKFEALTNSKKVVQENNGFITTFTVPSDKIENQELPFEDIIYAQVWDNVGNGSEIANTEKLMLEDFKPTAEIKPDEKAQCNVEVNGSSYSCYKEDTSFTITAADDTAVEGKPVINSGIRYLKVLINQAEVISEDYTDEPSKGAGKVKVQVRTDTQGVEPDPDGAYTIEVQTVDFAGNENNPVSLKVYKDNYVPSIGNIEKTPSVDWAKDTVTVSAKNVADAEVANAYTTGVERVVYSLQNDVSTGTDAVPVEGKPGEYQFTVEPECEVIYYIWAIDYAKNVSEVKQMAVNIDRTAPVITRFEFQGNGRKDESETDLKKAVDITEYGFYFKENVKVTIHALDKFMDDNKKQKPTSGLENITYYAQNKDGEIEYQETAAVDENGTVSFVIDKDFKGQIYAKAADIAGNTPEDDKQTADINEAFTHADGTAVESAAKHAETSDVALSIPLTAMKDRDGGLLYASDIPVAVNVTDSYSGIRKIEWSVTSPYDTQQNQSGSIEIDNGRSISGAKDGWNVENTELNLITSMSRTIMVRNNSNNITVKVKLTDRAGHMSEEEIHFSIDKTAPVTAVSYDNNAYDQDFIGEREYYSADRTATIQISERNFNPDAVEITLTNEYGSVPQLSGWEEQYNNEDPNLTTYTATLSYTDDGDYNFEIACKDLAGHEAADHNAASFIIDKTVPVISVEYDNNTSSGTYFDRSRTATITIEEKNFETGRIEITGTATDKGQGVSFPGVSGWSDSGDTHVTTISYSEDAEYSFSIAYTDKAGNQASAYGEDSFVIDQTEPELEITGIKDLSANREKVVPVIEWSDTNLSGDAEIKLTASNHGEVKPMGEFSEQGEKKIFTFDDFDYKQDKDDIYTLTAAVEDMAGNKTEKKIQFSVNRFGSVYTFTKDLKKIEGRYISKERDVVITETNVDSLTPESIKLKVSLNGKSRNLVADESYKLSKKGGEGSWSQYTYTIPAKEFKEEGNYIVSVTSKDAAGNVNENTDETKKAEIRFGIDKTAPSIIALNVEDGKTYPQDSMEVQFDISDNLVLDSVIIKVDGKEIKPETAEGEYSFNLDGSNNARSITVAAADAAENETALDISKFYVTTNLFIRWYTNTLLFAATIVVLVLLVSGGVVLLIRKGRK